MIEEIPGRPEGTLEFKITGRVSGADYDQVLVPALERALESRDHVKLLCQVGPGFEGYSFDAAWDDARMGMKHWRGFERVALVTDVEWIAASVRALGFALPCPIKIFPLKELEEARLWLAESLGSIHVDQLSAGHLKVVLLGKLEASAYQGVEETIDQYLAGKSNIRLLVDLREFDGWQGLGALGEHLSLVREHRRLPERVAVVGNKAWQRLAETVFSRFLNAEVRFFEAAEFGAAEAWIEAQ